MLRLDHVSVIVMREMRVHSIAGLGGSSVADSVGKNNEITIRVEQLSGSEQNTGKGGVRKSLSGAGGSVQHQYGVGDAPGGIANRPAVGSIVQPHLRQRLARAEVKVVCHEIPFGRFQNILRKSSTGKH